MSNHEMPFLNLNDIYAYVGEPILNWSGYKQQSETSEYSAYIGYYQIDSNEIPSKLFIGASNIYVDAYRGQYKGDEIVNLIIPGLKDLYKSYRKQLVNEEKLFLECINKQTPTFKNITEYKSIKYFNDITLYQFFGDITPYDVVHISLKEFINIINENKEFIIEFSPLNVRMKIFYDKSDFYYNKEDKIITNVNL